MKISENMKKKLMDETQYFGKVYHYSNPGDVRELNNVPDD